MKFLALLFLCVFAFSLTSAQIITKEKRIEKDSTGKETTTEATIISTSEDVTVRNNMVVINPLKFFLFYNLSFYHAFNRSLAFGIGFQFPTLKNVDGFGVNAEIRVHPRAKALRGFYFAPNVSFNQIEETSIVSIGGLIGWQWFPGEDFAMGLGIGIDYYLFGNENGDMSYYNGAAPALRFDIGYGW